MSRKKPTLGRGLGALLESAQIASEIETLEQPSSTLARSVEAKDKKYRELPVEFIVRSKYQPRKDMDQEALEELSRSIKQHGVMQPVVVRPVDENEKKFELIAGERRWRACQLAGIANIPVVIKNVSDEATLAMALIENIQREDLNPMEEAIAMARLKEQFDLTQQEVAEAVGKSRVTVTNLLRLNNLDKDVKLMLEHGDLEMGHARALLGLGSSLQEETAKTVVAKGLSVRQTEALVRKLQDENRDATNKKHVEKNPDPDVRQLEEDLSAKVGALVELKQSARGSGKLIISYKTLDELDGIISHIT